jgi:sensor c-di-GMP phosphodiesterase-like protein
LAYPSRTSLKIAAAVVGIIAAGVPIIFFNAWLRKQADDEVSINAAWVLNLAESRIGQAVAALQGMSARGVDSCGPSQIDAMRRTSLLTGQIKRVMLIGANGEILCADNGAAAERQDVLSSAKATNPAIVLDVVRVSDRGERFLRVRLAGQPGKPALAALVPASMLIPQTAMQGGRWDGAARIAMSDGTAVGDTGATPMSPTPATQFSDTLPSSQYPFSVTVLLPRKGVFASYDDLRNIGLVMTGAIAVIILLFALLFARREAADPTADMARAIRDDEFVPYYQPIVDLQSGRLLGAEVLVRWRRPDGSCVEPNAFVLLLESSGLVMEFTRKLMRRVRTDIGDAIGRRPGMTIAFNVAPRHFDDALILHDVGTIFNGSTVRLSQIVL